MAHLKMISAPTMYTSTDYATSHPSAITHYLVRFWKKMTLGAVRFFSVLGGNASRTKNIITLFNEFNVSRIAASLVVAYNMVKYIYTVVYRERGYHGSIHNSVDFLGLAPKIDNAIALTSSTSPQPAAILVNCNSGKDAFFFFGSKGNFKHNNILPKQEQLCNTI
jgi:hypothetical protein